MFFPPPPARQVDVGELLLDYSALVSGSAVALRNLPTGKHECVAFGVQGRQEKGGGGSCRIAYRMRSLLSRCGIV